MRYVLFIAIFTVCMGAKALSQSTIIVTIVDNNTATIEFKKGSDKTTPDKLEFSDGNGKLIVVNNTTTNQFSMTITATGVDLKIPSAKMPAGGSSAEFKISSAGIVENVSGEGAFPKNPTI